jgi:hypothetical protein
MDRGAHTPGAAFQVAVRQTYSNAKRQEKIIFTEKISISELDAQTDSKALLVAFTIILSPFSVEEETSISPCKL